VSDVLDVVLLLALPASGKSEVRKYLGLLDPEACARDFHMGPTVQLDDFPYVHMMRQTDEALRALGEPAVFFEAPDKSFKNPRDWGTLIELVNEDYGDLVAKTVVKPESAAQWLVGRLDRARARVCAPQFLHTWSAEVRASVCDSLEKEARDLLKDKHAVYPDTLEGKTVVIEFARGGPDGSSMPLPEPFGYAYSIGKLATEILDKATVLYIWVTPIESRRKNEARTDPNDPGSILHHGVPADVMMNDYGCDDMEHLIDSADNADHLRIEAHGRSHQLPVARFDNRVDKTSFIRGDASKWPKQEVDAVHKGLAEALGKLANAVG
jgi:hypothetical protein